MQTFLERLQATLGHVEEVAVADIHNLVKGLQDQYLRLALDSKRPPTLKSDEVVSQRRLLRDAALFLEMVVLARDNLQEPEVADALEVAATVFEYLSRTSSHSEILRWVKNDELGNLPGCLFNGPLNDFLRAGLLYALSGKQASGELMFNRLTRILAKTTLPANHQVVAEALMIVGRVIGGRSNDLEFALRAGWRLEGHAASESGLVEAVFLSVGRQALDVARSMLEGASTSSERYGHEAYELAKRSLNPGLHWFAWLSDRTMKALRATAVQVALQPYELPKSYVDGLIAGGNTRLWRSQVDALSRGILRSRDNFVVGLPTGAGKSLIAELVIVKELTHCEQAWCVYLAPSRALVRQIERELRPRLSKLGITVRTVLAGSEQARTIDEEIAELASARSVTVLTPEKLDVYLRFAPEAFATCKLCILDEAHLLGTADRGFRLELLLSVLRARYPELRFVLFSAALSNPHELAEWLGNPEGYVTADWRPTRQLKGLLVKDEATSRTSRQKQVKVSGRWVDEAEVPKRSGLPFRILTREDFKLGLVLVRDRDDLDNEGGCRFSYPQLLEASRTSARIWVPNNPPKTDREKPTTTAPELATRLAERLSGVGERQLLYFSAPDSAVKAAKELAAAESGRTTLRTSRVARTVATLLGPDDQLVKCLEQGVAYHHAGLPTTVKRIVEVAAKRGDIKILCATSTLQEGLNMPVQTVIIAGGRHYDEDNPRNRSDIPVSDFENIAGRAGRAYIGTEGLVVFVPEDFYQVGLTVGQSDKYMFVDKDSLKVKSAMIAILQEFENWSHPAESNSLGLSPQAELVVLTLNRAGLVTEDQVSDFLSHSFGGRTAQPRVKLRVQSRICGALSITRQRFGDELLTLFGKTGLSITSCSAIYNRLSELVQSGTDLSLRSDGDLDLDVLEMLIESIAQAPELWSGLKWPKLPYAVHAKLVFAWLKQLELGSVLAAPELKPHFKRAIDHGDLLRYFSSVETTLSWGFGVIFLMLEYLCEQEEAEVDPEIGALPLYTRFGVESLSAAFIALLGVSDRVSAAKLAQLYSMSRRPKVTFSHIEGWLNRLTIEDIERALPDDPVRREVLMDDLRLEVVNSSPRKTQAVMLCKRIPDSHYVQVVLQGERVMGVASDGSVVGAFDANTTLDAMVKSGRCYGYILSDTPGLARVEVFREVGSARPNTTPQQ